jgi:hypothetical protein
MPCAGKQRQQTPYAGTGAGSEVETRDMFAMRERANEFPPYLWVQAAFVECELGFEVGREIDLGNIG